jgi:ribonuclease P protein component
MLASKNRLKKKINFARIEIDGKMIQSRSFGMGIFNRKDEDESRFGFIISTKISKKAVTRNRIKRIMSEVIRFNLTKLKKGLDIVFLIKPSIIKIDKIELEKETYEAITKNIQNNTLSNS